MFFALLMSHAYAVAPSFEEIWKRAETVVCSREETLARLPPETAMQKLEAMSYLTEDEVAVVNQTLATHFDEAYLKGISINKSDCAQARLALGKAARRGPKSLAPRLRAILAKPKTPTILNLAIDMITLHEGLKEKFFDAPKALITEVQEFRMAVKREGVELESGYAKFAHEEFYLWEPGPETVAKFKALPDVQRLREVALKEYDVTKARYAQFRALLAKLP